MVTLIQWFFTAWEWFLRLRLRAVQAIGFCALWGAVWLLPIPLANPFRAISAGTIAAPLLAGLHSRHHRWLKRLEDTLYRREPSRCTQGLLLHGLAHWRTRLSALGLMGMGWPDIPVVIRTRSSEKGVFRYQDGLGVVVDPLEETE